MVLALADSADKPVYMPAMGVAGYALRIRKSDCYEPRFLRGPDTNFKLHVFSLAHPEIVRLLLFRDWLRSTDADRDLYERTKRELAKRTWKYVRIHGSKTSVVEGNQRACP
jgi:GrpB-like predicted nucleotidyltransferase (UPF0157 family)